MNVIRISGKHGTGKTSAAEDLANQRSYHHPGRIGYVLNNTTKLDAGSSYHTIIADGLTEPLTEEQISQLAIRLIPAGLIVEVMQ